MLEDAGGSADRLHIRAYHKGEEYIIGSQFMDETLALAFIENGSAELIKHKATPEQQVVVETKPAHKEETPVKKPSKPT